MNTENGKSDGRREKCYNGKIVFYHPNKKCNGAAARLELRLNRAGEEGYDCFFLEMARQKSLSNGKGNATFDWGEKVTVKLGFLDVCEFLTVLEGRAKSVGGERNSLYHQNGSGNTLIGLSARDDGRYLLGLSRKTKVNGEQKRLSISLSQVEATGLRHVLQTGLFFISFHSSLRIGAMRAEPA